MDVGLILENGTVQELRAGTLFYIPAVPHDSWVVGSEPYVSLHFLGAKSPRHVGCGTSPSPVGGHDARRFASGDAASGKGS
jgi:hypothetical protein